MKIMTHKQCVRLLRKTFCINGCVRIKNSSRLESEGHQKYKKGFEVRLVSSSEEDLDTLKSACYELDIRTGHEFMKRHQFILPLYGRKNVDHFLSLIGEPGLEKRMKTARDAALITAIIEMQEPPPGPGTECNRVSVIY